MIEIIEKKNCCGCGACVNACPKHCISLAPDNEGFCYPQIDKEECVNCGMCKKVCPNLIKRKAKSSNPYTKVFATKNNNADVRMKSSSGGVFSLLAEYVLEQNGIVFGVGFDSNYEVCHQSVSKKEDLSKLRGSKYVQSNTKDTFQQAKRYLDENRLVLFSGTTCQISGLKSYLKKDYENLITQDVICHGVPSPLLWKRYIQHIQQKNKSNIIGIDFRDKRTGWKNFSFTINFENGERYSKVYIKEPYLNMFIFNKSLRPSCYHCNHKGFNRQSDITLGDFWGSAIKKAGKSLNDNKGCTLVVINSPKGEKLFAAIDKSITKCEVSARSAFRANPMMKTSAIKHPLRRSLMNALKNDIDMEKVSKRFGKMLF